MYVNLNKTIYTFWYLTLPLLAINVAWLIKDIILNLEKCVMLGLMYFNNGKWEEGEMACVKHLVVFTA